MRIGRWRSQNTALDRGIRYFDTAWVYSEGQSERRVGLVARQRRQEMWIATKTVDETRDGALRRFPFDTALVAVSALDHFIYSFAEEFLPVAARQGVGVVGMKVFAYQGLAHVAERALSYARALPLTTVIAGCSTMAELDADLVVAEGFTPMTGPERLAFFRELLPLVMPENLPWKADDWDNPLAWKPRQEPGGLKT